MAIGLHTGYRTFSQAGHVRHTDRRTMSLTLVTVKLMAEEPVALVVNKSAVLVGLAEQV